MNKKPLKPSCNSVKKMLLTGWHSNFELIKNCGTEALRRVRELRTLGYPVRMKRKIVDGKCTNTFLYRLGR